MSTLADSSSTMTSESKDKDSTTSSISKQYKIAKKQAEEYCETNSADQIENDIQEFDSRKSNAGEQKVAQFLRMVKLKKDIKSRNQILKAQNKKTNNKEWDLRKYQNIGCMHYDVNNMNEVTSNCKVTKDKIKVTLNNFKNDMEYLFSLQENVEIKVYFKLDMVSILTGIECWDEDILENIDELVKEIDKYIEQLMENLDYNLE